MRIAIQMDHPTRLNPLSDTTFMLIEEAQKRGHTVFFYEAPMLSWNAGDVVAPLAPITIDMQASPVWKLGDAKTTSLREMNVVLMRQDPPFDMAYITATHLLEQLPPSVKILNHPKGVRNAPEKLSILNFAQFMPPTLISRDPSQIHAFVTQHGTVVAKPLYGFGGRSVYKLAAGDSNIETLIEQSNEQSLEPLMWQAFLPAVASEDKRILFIDGEVAAVFGRVPPEGSIRANTRIGGTPKQTELTPKQTEICAALSPFLKQQGLMLAGIDVIGDVLTEINVTSPTGLRAVQRLYGTNLAETFWDMVEKS
jgi:glutathione synthase